MDIEKRDGDVFMVSLCRLQHIGSLLSQLNGPLKSTNLISFFKSQEVLVIDLTHPAALQKRKKKKLHLPHSPLFSTHFIPVDTLGMTDAQTDSIQAFFQSFFPSFCDRDSPALPLLSLHLMDG